MPYNVVVDHRIGWWVAQAASSGRYDPAFSQAIGLIKDNEPVAGVVFTDYNGRSMTVHQAINGKITREFLHKVSDYAFNQCRVEKLIGPVDSSNEKAIKLVENMGFKEEARIKDAHPKGDMILFTLLKENCRFLGERYGKKCTATANA